MDGATHRKIAPVFTAGVTYVTLAAQNYSSTTMLSALAVASGVSIISANWPDADLHAMHKPVPAIWAGTKIGGLFGVKKGKVVSKENPSKRKTVYIYNGKRYTRTKGMAMKILATIFRLVGVRGHRVWQSHSPLLWVPLTLMSYGVTLNLLKELNEVAVIIAAIPLGLGYGYLSHLFGDGVTYKGLPLLPEFRFLWKIPIIGGIIKKITTTFSDLRIFKFKFAKASNKTWNELVFLLTLVAVGYLIIPKQMNMLFLVTLEFLKGFIVAMVNLLQFLTSNLLS